MQDTPQGMRMHIGIFGRRNVGKSTLLNAVTGQDVAIVSEIPGTTTDVVSKPIELKPIGPVIFLDTAGLDDTGSLGNKRIEKTMAAMDRVDMAFVVLDTQWGQPEHKVIQQLKQRKIPFIVVINKSDLGSPASDLVGKSLENNETPVLVSAKTGTGIDILRKAIVDHAPESFFNDLPIVADLIGPGDTVIMVVPVDLEAPKGRLILPQVQVIREVLDCDAKALVVKERELLDLLDNLKHPPQLVITDSQAILKVNADVPASVPLTGFSVLFARWKGDLETFVKGTQTIDHLKPGDRILILESCSHHPIGEDIGRVKIPRWLMQYVGGDLLFEHEAGHDFPADLSSYRLIIHCGACMTNRREVLTRILRAQEAGVPIANYGLVIAKSLGVFERILSPFPGIQDLLDHPPA
ncbi:[FeFe] hydrogenase H-cluster maturation GTPase HydF [bacterium]|nr:[FeFe] hydrogenase H-cluster maturation GTPase HydF [bacterium]